MRTAFPLLALLAACQQAPVANETAATAAMAQPPSAFQNQVEALPVGQRNAVLIRAIRDATFDCQGVVESHRQGEGQNGDPLYVARCQGDKYYGVVFGRDGTAQVFPRGDR